MPITPTPGTDASNAGFTLVLGTDLASDLEELINRLADQVVALAIKNVRPIAYGGTGASTPAGAQTALGLDSAATKKVGAFVANVNDPTNGIGLTWASPRLGIRIDGTNQGDIALLSDVLGRVDKNGDTMPGQFKNPYARNNGVASWIALGVAPDGTLGFQSSTRRLKKQIKAWSPDRQAVLAMQLVTYHYKVAAWDGPEHESPLQVGLIAEDLHDLGLDWLVIYDDEGLPAGIHYERIALALLPVIQDHEARIVALEQERQS